MPVGQIHKEAHARYKDAAMFLCTVTSFIATGASIIITKNPLMAVVFPLVLGFSTIGYDKGERIDPDSDQMSFTRSDGNKVRKYGIAGWIFITWWTLYAIAMNVLAFATGTNNGSLGGHRTFWTHSYVFSTIIRMVWQYIPHTILISTIPFSEINPTFLSFAWIIVFYILLGEFIGLAYSDAVHIWLDQQEKKAKKAGRL